MLGVTLDKEHKWLEEWDNEVHFYSEDEERIPSKFIKKIPDRNRKMLRRCNMTEEYDNWRRVL